jgi:uncharacterized protein (TIGR02265 family)
MIRAVLSSQFPPARGSVPLRPHTAPASSPGVTVKGFYLSAMVRELATHGHHLTSRASFRDFSDYSLTQAREILDETVLRLYPQERRGEGQRRVGWIIYPTLLSTMVGRVIFGSLGHDLGAVLGVLRRGFEVSISRGSYEPVEIRERDAHVRVRDFPLYPDTFLLGAFEGLLAHYDLADGKVEVKKQSATDVDFYLSW